MDFPCGSVVKYPPANARDAGDMGQEDPLEEEVATHSSILAWEMLWTKEPHGLQSMGSQKSQPPEHTCAHEGCVGIGNTK